MVISAEPLIYGLIFVAVLALVQGIYLTVFGKSISLNSRVNRRLEMLEKGAGREQVLEQLRKEMSQHMKSKSIPLYSILAEKAQKANIAFTPQQLVMVMGVMGVVAFVLLTFGTSASTPMVSSHGRPDRSTSSMRQRAPMARRQPCASSTVPRDPVSRPSTGSATPSRDEQRRCSARRRSSNRSCSVPGNLKGPRPRAARTGGPPPRPLPCCPVD